MRPPWLVTLEHDGTSMTAVLDPADTVTNDPKRDQALAFCGSVIPIDLANIHELTLRLRHQVQNEENRP